MMSAKQHQFINQVVDYLTQNGVMKPARLFESPFTDFAPSGVDGVFDDADANDIVQRIKGINENAVA